MAIKAGFRLLQSVAQRLVQRLQRLPSSGEAEEATTLSDEDISHCRHRTAGAYSIRMLQPLDPARPSPMSSLADELLIQIVRFTVATPDTLDIHDTAAHQRLLAPFADFPRLKTVAEDELTSVNTFSLDLDGLSKSTESFETFGEPKLATLCCGSLKNILHLDLHVSIIMAGGTFNVINDLFPATWFDSTVDVLRRLQHIFPKLRSLHVEAENFNAEDTEKLADIFGPVYSVDNLRHFVECPHFDGYKHMERLLKMQKVLMLVDAAQAPNLRHKFVTFVQRETDGPAISAEDGGFGPMFDLPCPAPAEGRPTVLQRARAGLLFCEMREEREARDIFLGGQEPRLQTCMNTKEQLRQVYESEMGKADKAFLEGVLEESSVEVRFPC